MDIIGNVYRSGTMNPCDTFRRYRQNGRTDLAEICTLDFACRSVVVHSRVTWTLGVIWILQIMWI